VCLLFKGMIGFFFLKKDIIILKYKKNQPHFNPKHSQSTRKNRISTCKNKWRKRSLSYGIIGELPNFCIATEERQVFFLFLV